MSEKTETWQVMCDAGIFETELEGLREWVAQGRIQAHDKVRKSGLRWIEAGRAPVLRAAFASVRGFAATPSNVAVAEPASFETDFVAEEQSGFVHESFPHEQAPHAFNAGSGCHFHAGLEPRYICRACGATFCESCTKLVNKIALCPLCGDLCKLFAEVRQRTVRRREQGKPLGFEDFSTAVSYPFSNLFALVGGALLYSFLLLAGFKGKLLAYAVLFGCISIVINKVATGRMDRNFLPDFSDFSWLDDFLTPIFLGIGVTLVTLGPAILLAVALVAGVIHSSAPSPADSMKQQYAEQNKTITPEDVRKLVNGGSPQDEEELRKKLDEAHPASSMKRMTEGSKDSDQSSLSTLRWLFSASGVVIPFLVLSLVWAVFYYPMALSIAGYTEDFWSVINPMVGIDTIRRMGATYFKAFGMYLAVQFVGSIMSAMAYTILAPFDMPFVGNLPARFVEGTFTFYTSLVIACILGLALYKSADKLDISTD